MYISEVDLPIENGAFPVCCVNVDQPDPAFIYRPALFRSRCGGSSASGGRSEASPAMVSLSEKEEWLVVEPTPLIFHIYVSLSAAILIYKTR